MILLCLSDLAAHLHSHSEVQFSPILSCSDPVGIGYWHYQAVHGHQTSTCSHPQHTPWNQRLLQDEHYVFQNTCKQSFYTQCHITLLYCRILIIGFILLLTKYEGNICFVGSRDNGQGQHFCLKVQQINRKPRIPTKL